MHIKYFLLLLVHIKSIQAAIIVKQTQDTLYLYLYALTH